jgi:hypothetical protein
MALLTVPFLPKGEVGRAPALQPSELTGGSALTRSKAHVLPGHAVVAMETGLIATFRGFRVDLVV